MKTLIILITKILYYISKLFVRGRNNPGKLALKMDGWILKKIKLPDNIIVITGSNGKSSTLRMVNRVLQNAGFSVACNIKEDIQIEGIATTIIKNSTLPGVVNKDVLLIECDERYLTKIFYQIKPKYFVVTNLYRDNMAQNGHPEFIYKLINDELTQDIHLILNADDPLTSLLGYNRDNVTYFGINKNYLSNSENQSAYNDGKYCPNCKSLMLYDYYHFNHIGSYRCPKCGHKRKAPNYAITNLDLESGVMVINKKHKIPMKFRSIYNAYDLLTTFSVARIFGVDENVIVSSLTEYASTNDVIKETNLDDYEAVLINAKYDNSISFNQSLMYVINQKKDCIVIININNLKISKIIDTSWVWDIDFELLSENNIKKIILTGDFMNELAVRFQNTDINMDKVIIGNDYKKSLSNIDKELFDEIYIITNIED